jgi:hypothetical protein
VIEVSGGGCFRDSGDIDTRADLPA